MAVTKWKLGTLTTVLSTGTSPTGLDSVVNNAISVSSAYDNTQGQTGDGYTLCDVELCVTYGVAPTANTAVAVWFLGSADGTNYEDGGTSVTPARMPDVVFPVRAVTTAQRQIKRVSLPWGLTKVLLKNDGTGQAMASSGNTLKIKPVTTEIA